MTARVWVTFVVLLAAISTTCWTNSTTLTIGGLGLVLLPDRVVGIELREGYLRPVLTNYQAVPATRAIHALYPRGLHLPPKIRAFVGFLVERFSGRGPVSSA